MSSKMVDKDGMHVLKHVVIDGKRPLLQIVLCCQEYIKYYL
jgi:hypothetical protein